MLDFFASLLYPKKCVRCKRGGDYICDNCFTTISFLENQLCAVCQKGSIDGMTHPKCRTPFSIEGILSAISYKGIVKKLLYQFKYPPYLSDLKGVLGKILYEGLIQEAAFIKFTNHNNLWITSVPLNPKREKLRGYNQSELLGKELAKRLGKVYVPGILVRIRQTKPQFELKKEERRKNILGAFEISKNYKNKLKEVNIIIVDDITTTGATLRECGKVLKKSGAGKVIGVTLAHEG